MVFQTAFRVSSFFPFDVDFLSPNVGKDEDSFVCADIHFADTDG